MRLKLPFLIISLFFCLPSLLHAQNLIYNGDFEIYSNCPWTVSTPGDYQIEFCSGWYSPTYATPDYFNSCTTWPFIVGVPLNGMGYQIAKSGEGYLGFFSFSTYDSLGTIVQWREYVQSELIYPLVSGRTYSFTFYLSLSDLSPLACSKVGIWLTDYAYFANNSRPIPFDPQIKNTAGNNITDKTNWTKLSGSFIANGGEKFITIGPYDNETNIDTIRVSFPADPFGWAYYYLDGCTLIDITDSINQGKDNVFIPNIFSPNNDGQNDIIYVRGENISTIDLVIYNRWGEEVFNSTNINLGWDGTFKSKECDNAVFFYYLKVQYCDGTEKIKKGNITLIR